MTDFGFSIELELQMFFLDSSEDDGQTVRKVTGQIDPKRSRRPKPGKNLFMRRLEANLEYQITGNELRAFRTSQKAK